MQIAELRKADMSYLLKEVRVEEESWGLVLDMLFEEPGEVGVWQCSVNSWIQGTGAW